MNRVVFYLKEFHMGGAQLLIVRLATRFVEMGYETAIIGVFSDEKIYADIQKAHIKAITIDEWDNDRVARRIIRDACDSAYVITMNWQDYCRIVYLKGNTESIIFYAVHFNDVVAAVKNRFGIVEFINRVVTTKTIETLINRQTIIAMDEDTVQKTQEFYHFSVSTINSFKIIRIAIDYNDNLYPIEMKFMDEDFRVLTIARADFPFKGYLAGLVSIMKSNLLPPNTIIEIVSSGKDQKTLEKLVAECDECVKKRIMLYGKVEYDKLENLYKKCRVFVGMGTALLDAAKYGTIAIPVVSYTEEVKSTGFFHDDYRCIVAKEGSKENFLQGIAWIETLNKEDYSQYFEMNSKLIRDFYSAESVVAEMIKVLETCANNDDCLLKCKLSYLVSKCIRGIKFLTRRNQ